MNDASPCQIVIDYMEVYLEFLKPTSDGFKKAREILRKYENSNIDAFGFRESFQKMIN